MMGHQLVRLTLNRLWISWDVDQSENKWHRQKKYLQHEACQQPAIGLLGRAGYESDNPNIIVK